MAERKLTICMLNSNDYDPKLPTRPEIIEIYGNFLSSFGHKIIWISKGDVEKTKKLAFKETDIYIIPYRYHKSTLMKSLNLVIHTYKKYKLIKKIQFRTKIDIIQSRLDIFNALLCLKVSRKFKVLSVYQIHFPQPIFTYTYKNRIIKNIALFLEKLILKKTDLILPNNSYMLDYLKNKNIEENKMHILPMGVNPDTFSPNQKNEKLIEKYNLFEQKIIIYIGTLDKFRHLETIIKAFAIVKENFQKTKLLMVGEGNGKEGLKKLTQELKIENDVLFIGKVHYSEIQNYLNLADIGLCPIPPLSKFIMSSPTKLFEYMSSELAVIGNTEILEIKEVLNKSNGGILVNFNYQSFADGILKLFENDQIRRDKGKNGREWVIKNKSYENISKEIENIYFEALNNRFSDN